MLIKKIKKIAKWFWATMARRVVASAVLAAVFGLPLWALFAPNAEAAWWNDTWLYRKAIPITNSSGSALSDFQVKILDNKDLSADITAGKIQANLNDLRFTDQNGDLLAYWIEDSTAASVDVWVKLSSIPTNGSTIYLYYGNPTATAYSDGNRVFDFFDDFNNANGSLNQWSYTDPAGGLTTSFTGQEVRRSGTPSGTDVWSSLSTKKSLYNYRVAELNIKVNSYSGGEAKLLVSDDVYLKQVATSGWKWQYYSSGWYDIANSGITTGGSAIKVKLVEDATGVSIYENGTYLGKRTLSRGSADAVLSFSAENYYGGNSFSVDIDNVFVRKYASSDPSIGTFASEEKGPGPVAYWKFDEGFGTNAQDSTAQNNDGTLTNMSATASPTSGWQTEDKCVSGKCLAFDGTDDSVVVSNGAKISSYNTSRTVSVWFRAGSLGAQRAIMSAASTAKSGSPLWLLVQNASNLLSVYHGSNYRSGTTVLQANKWYYATYTFDSSNNATKLYLDGKVEYSATVADTNTASTNIYIGDGYNANFKGYIDEPKVYPYVRTADQIKADYNAGLSGMASSQGTSASFGDGSDKWMSDGLVGYWKMDEASWNGTAGEVKDANGNGNNGTASGSATTTPGKFGSAGLFDTSTKNIALSSGISVNATDYAISTWAVFPLPTTAGSYRTLARSSVGDHPVLVDANGFLGVWVGAFKTSGYDVDNLTAGWHHIVAVADNAKNQTKFYVDGSYVGTSIAKSNENISYLGNYQGGNQQFGTIDDLRIYNRMLSPTEIIKLFDWAPGPIAHYKLDENTGTTTQDSSGNNNAGTLTNGPTWTRGKIGGAVNFDGTDDYIAGSSNLGISGNPSFTMCAWIKWSGAVWSSDWPSFMGNNSTGTGNQGLSFTLSYGRPAIDFWNNRWRASAALTVGTWYHVCGVKTSGTISTTSKIYVNGSLVSGAVEGTDGNPNITNAVPIIGRLDATRRFQGQIDDVRYYNYARSAEQIMQDMTGNVAASDLQSSKEAILYWKFDEGTGNVVYDQSAQKNNGILECSNFTYADCTKPTWTNEGKYGKALSFSGEGTYPNPGVRMNRVRGSVVNVPSETGARITLSMWVNPSGDATGDNYIVRNGAGTDLNYAINLGVPTGGKYKVIFNGYDTTWRTVSSSGYIVPAQQWSHLVVVYSQGEWVRVYVNGALQEQIAWSFGATVQAVSTFAVAGHGGAATQWFNGLIDEVKVYNYALSTDDVKTEYNRSSAVNLSSSGPITAGGADSAKAEYCPPGNTEGNCASGQNPAPVGEWKLDEGSGTMASDASGNGNDATLVGGTTWKPGKFGKAVLFNGANLTKATVPDAASIRSMANFTASAWVNFDSLTNADGDAYNYIFNKYGWFLRVSNAGVVDFSLRTSGSYPVVSSDVAITTGRWYYVSVVFSGVGASSKIYIDGRDVSTGLFSGTGTMSGDSGTNLFIASAVNDYDGNAKGNFDQMRIYNYVRTPAQIAWDYNRGGPVGWWKLDECQGGTAYDNSGNGNNGTITIGATGTQTAMGTCQTSGTAWGNGATGKWNASLSLDGTDDYVTIPHKSALMPTSVTVSGWVKFNSNSSWMIVNKAPGNTPGSYYIYGDSLSDGMWSIFGPTATRYNCSVGSLTTGTWYHLVGTFDATSGVQKCYLDGKLKNTTTGAALGSNISDVYLGKYTSGYQTNGQIDDVQIYNYALSADQVKLLYNGGASLRFGQ